MVEGPHTRFMLPDRSYQAIVRSEIRKIAEQAGFKGHRMGEAEIIIAEITSNLVKYASKGAMILAKPLSKFGGGLEIIAIDDGPGIQKLKWVMEDGRSTRSSLGQGLGAIKRLSDEFDLYSIAGWGTILFSRIYAGNSTKEKKNRFGVETISVPRKDETVSGDGWFMVHSKAKTRLVLIDGLGHGVGANVAALAAINSFRSKALPMPVGQLKLMHEELRKSRGVVATVVHIEELFQRVVYSGVGNISMKIVSNERAQGCSTYNGIVGHIMPNSINDHTMQINIKDDILVMHSDGLSSRWDIKKYPNILNHHPIMLCAALYKDHDRKNDDTTILVGKFENSAA